MRRVICNEIDLDQDLAGLLYQVHLHHDRPDFSAPTSEYVSVNS